MPEAPGHAAPPVEGWRDAELANPHAHADKSAKVRAMFGAIARSYDLNNAVHSLGQDRRWRNFAVRQAAVRPGDVVLDVACGTGALTRAFAARSPASLVIGADYTRAMLDIAARDRPDARTTYIEADAMRLPMADASVDVVSIAFGIRNVQDPRRALGEFARVLRPGGRLVVLEFDRPRNAVVRWFNDLYCGRVMPRTATWLSGDRSGAYRYLPASVGAFMSREQMVDAIRQAGCTDVTATPLSWGICVCYRAIRGN
ncbi:MAG: bifunctional demethylmenaquinone methyltransferase/2-methoxy-6-polyprenyl-1,4-benzoquinol methylase UbiE [Planctomycetota bacterium]|nr:bifunctional demethylmenaquinone methyltransferase/2-methoxy-6-polyprenyl-1,4-benzoquinol methylase UbiE [Planctomycetota bacterium]